MVIRLALRAAVLPALVALAVAPSSAGAQPRANVPGMQPNGPVVNSTGFSIKVENPSFTPPEGHDFKVVWVIDKADSASANQQLTTIARFLNVHARHGVPASRVHTAAVVHGGGASALLTDAAYAARNGGKPNPSRVLVEELLAAGTQLVLCGQTAGGRGITQADLIPGAKIAISAMTALNVFQAQGYQINPW